MKLSTAIIAALLLSACNDKPVEEAKPVEKTEEAKPVEKAEPKAEAKTEIKADKKKPEAPAPTK